MASTRRSSRLTPSAPPLPLYIIMVRARKEVPKGSTPLPSTFLGDTPRSCGLSTPLGQSLQAHHHRGVPRPSERSYPSNITLHTELYWSQSRPILLYVTSYIGSCTDLYWFIPPTYIALPTKAYHPPKSPPSLIATSSAFTPVSELPSTASTPQIDA